MRTFASACPDAETLAAFVDGRLRLADRRLVEAHLADCDDCREVVADVAHAAADLETSPPASGDRRDRRAWWLGAAAAAAVLAAIWLGPFSTRGRLDRAVAELASLSATSRAIEARLDLDAPWAPPPDAVRSATAPADLRPDQMRLLSDIRTLAGEATDAHALTALGTAALLTGRTDEAIDRLNDAAAADASGRATRLALSAAYFERWRRDGRALDLTLALDENERVLDDGPSAAALFNRALALEALGLVDQAIEAWEAVRRAEADTSWATEAGEHLTRLRARSAPGGSTGALPGDLPALAASAPTVLERALDAHLSAWAAGTVLPAEATAMATSLERAGRDLVRPAIVKAIAGATRDRPTATCLADAIAASQAASVAFDLSDYNASLVSAVQARDAARCAGLLLASFEADVAWAQYNKGDQAAAMTHIEVIHAAALAAGHIRGAARMEYLRGRNLAARAYMADALAAHESALRLAEAAGDDDLAATLENARASAYRTSGDDERAWICHRRALERWPALTPRRRHIVAAGAMLSAAETGLDGAALLLADIVEANAHQWQHPAGVVAAAIRRAEIEGRRGRLDVVDRALSAAREALARFPEGSTERPAYVAEIALVEGTVYATRDPARAIQALDTAADGILGRGVSSRLPLLLLTRARANVAAGDERAARADLAAGIELFDDQRQVMRDAQLRISRLDDSWGLFAEAIELARADALASLSLAERSRGRALLDALARDQTRAAPLEGAALHTWMPAGMTALVYATLPDHLYRWRVTAGGVTVSPQAVSRATLEALVRQHVDDLRAGRPSRTGPELARLLLPADLDADPRTTLAVLPDGPLHRLPFTSLPHPGTGRPLVADLTSVVAPSLTILRTTIAARPSGAARAVLVGYGAARPEAGLAQLPSVDREIDAIRPLYRQPLVLRDEAATAERILAAAVGADVIHLAGHAVANEIFPSESRLFVAPTASDSGELRPETLAGVRLPVGSVVVLSACDTFAGRVYRGEGPMALARPFLAAGASGVVATLWPVSDRGAAALARAIHERLSAGQPAAVAVAAAVRALAGTLPDAYAFQVWGS